MEKTTCYQCEESIEAPEGAVHPLCGDCQNEADDWLQTQMMVFN